jgi:hypothetical protein
MKSSRALCRDASANGIVHPGLEPADFNAAVIPEL